MPADNSRDALDRWLNQQVRPLPPPDGTFDLIVRRARRRRIRKTVVSVASAAAVAAAVAVAVPVGMSLHLTTGSASASLAERSDARSPAAGTQSTLGTGVEGTSEPAPSASSVAPTASAPAGPAGAAGPGYLPPDFSPSSVTWDSTSTGWVIGPAGTPGHCANSNPDICTSIARTDDGGQTWQGLPAPPVGGPMAATGVTGLRFLNAAYGWAFGPELWATDDGGQTWHKVNTGGSSVTDLETASGRAYALFASCAPPAGTSGDTIANCTSYTLETAAAGSDNWTPVGGVPAALSAAGTARSGTGPSGGTQGTATEGAASPGAAAGGGGQRGSAVIEFAGATARQAATGYLVAPDGTLYAGPLDGTAWHRVAALPCAPGPAANSGLPRDTLLAPAGTTSAGGTRLALVCAGPDAGDTTVYLSSDNGVTWAKQAGVGSSGLSHVGTPQSLTTLPDGTLILATEGSGPASGGTASQGTGSGDTGSGGIYLLAPGASQWRAATLSDPSGKRYGFTYVGMTSAAQGVALGGDPNLHAIWMTTDGGRTWQVRPIRSS